MFLRNTFSKFFPHLVFSRHIRIRDTIAVVVSVVQWYNTLFTAFLVTRFFWRAHHTSGLSSNPGLFILEGNYREKLRWVVGGGGVFAIGTLVSSKIDSSKFYYCEKSVNLHSCSVSCWVYHGKSSRALCE